LRSALLNQNGIIASDEPKNVIKNWMRSKDAIEFLGLWEQLHNEKFKGVEFDSFRSQAGSNAFTLSPQKWIDVSTTIREYVIFFISSRVPIQSSKLQTA